MSYGITYANYLRLEIRIMVASTWTFVLTWLGASSSQRLIHEHLSRKKCHNLARGILKPKDLQVDWN
jgi:hypothetical protein